MVEAEPDWYLRARYPLEYEHIVSAHARNYDLDPALLAAVIYAESRFDADVESSAGAVGLMQLLPETAKGIALRTGGAEFVVSDLRDPEINVRYGSWYLDHLRERYDGDMRLALAAYHAGQGTSIEWLEEGGDRLPGDAGLRGRGRARHAGVREGVPRRAPPIASRSRPQHELRARRAPRRRHGAGRDRSARG